MGNFNMQDYVEVADRIPLFWAAYPEGAITTDLAVREGPEVVIRATLWRSHGVPLATGYAREVEGRSPVNKTSHLENAETSAIGRALANAGFTGSAKRASRQEMEKVKRQQGEHDEMLEYISTMGAKVKNEELKERVRREWKAAKEQFTIARALADAIETALDAEGAA